MTPTAQHCAVTGILSVCLLVTALGAVGAQAVRPRPASDAEDPAVLAQLEAVEPALAQLTEATGRYAADADAASREALERALAGFAEIRAAVERVPAAASSRQRAQLLEVVRALVPRIHVLAIEIADGATPEKVALLERLAGKTRAALAQLREGPARQAETGSEKIANLAPGATESFVAEGAAVLFLTVVCAISMAIFSSAAAGHPLPRTLARESRPLRCLQE